MKFLDRLASAYYGGHPLVSNELFDELAKKYNYNKVGTASEKEIAHRYRMYSLQKVYPGEGVPFEGGLITPKLDGAAISAYYENGRLIWAATRGDGLRGQDITDKAAHLLPGYIPRACHRNFQVSGEIVAPIGVDNIRNYASGALNLKSVDEFLQRDLRFFAYDMVPNECVTYTDTLEVLKSYRFRTVIDAGHDNLNKDTWPTDGQVVRIMSNQAYKEMGYTSKHPRGAYALKENKAPEVTTLLDVVWQVGRSGAVSPVAILEPVNIDGASVSRATLHNWKYIEELGLEIGCKVEVIRAGEIIPRVLRKV